MNWEPWFVFALLFCCLLLFVSGRWRYDVISALAMVALVVVGIIPTQDALHNFGHPAVITVAAVLIISRALRQAGLTHHIAENLKKYTETPTAHVGLLTSVVTGFSAFMNNVGALALMLPVAVATAEKHKRSTSMLLMPLAFGSILGGLVTLFGTPPNIIIANYREDVTGYSFAMFDYAPVGLAVAVSGVLFISLIGWRLIPKQRQSSVAPENLFGLREYICEVRIKAESPLVDKRIGQIELFQSEEIIPVGLVRESERVAKPSKWRQIKAGDLLILKADPSSLQSILVANGLELVADAPGIDEIESENVHLAEAIVTRDSPLSGRGARYLYQRSVGTVYLLALARQGRTIASRLHSARFQTGDVILLQGEEAALQETISNLNLLPLAERDLNIPSSNAMIKALTVFVIALLAAAVGFVSVPIAFIGAICAYIVLDVLPIRDIYKDVDWPVIIFLGAMLSVGQALETSGAAEMVAEQLVIATEQFSPPVILAIVMIITMTLSDLVNNAATALIMAPISYRIAQILEVSVDPFLMAVALGASCAFLTPIGHQSNTLVMGPGGYHFADYWRMGLPLQILIVIVALPMIMLVWPF